MRTSVRKYIESILHCKTEGAKHAPPIKQHENNADFAKEVCLDHFHRVVPVKRTQWYKWISESRVLILRPTQTFGV